MVKHTISGQLGFGLKEGSEPLVNGDTGIEQITPLKKLVVTDFETNQQFEVWMTLEAADTVGRALMGSAPRIDVVPAAALADLPAR